MALLPPLSSVDLCPVPRDDSLLESRSEGTIRLLLFVKNRPISVASGRRFGRVGVAFAAALALTACGGGGAKPTLKCFPKEAQKWIYQSDKKDAATDGNYSQPVTAKMATIYVDRSASMVGYLNGADNDNRPFQILLGNLPTLAKIAGTDAQFRAFGKNISEPLPVAASKDMQNAAYYTCAKGNAGTCESAESHLDRVFAMVAGNKE